jgi:hypothetical protein
VEKNNNVSVGSSFDKVTTNNDEKSSTPTLSELLNYFFRLLYLSRVGSISAIIGSLIILTPQARDLFLDLRSSPWIERIYWSIFYFLLIFGWLLPIYFSTDYMIERCDNSPTAKTKIGKALKKTIPLLIVLACLVSVGFSQYSAWTGLNTTYNALPGDQGREDLTWPIPNLLLLIQATMLAAVLFISSRIKLDIDGVLNRNYFFYSIGMIVAVTLIWIAEFSPQDELKSYLSDDQLRGYRCASHNSMA